ncbi:hypothetical protein [Streptomyces bottropensis]|uniref:hypothetical protein n=1 Tax=Streptomyces bottropensis TaxID=42235 RepID=UPI0036A7DF6B
MSVLAGQVAPSTGLVHRARTVRLHLLGQESPHTTRRRARDLYEAHTARLVSAGLLKEDEVVGLGALGLLASRDADKPVADLSTGQQRRLDLALALATRTPCCWTSRPTTSPSPSSTNSPTPCTPPTRPSSSPRTTVNCAVTSAPGHA